MANNRFPVVGIGASAGGVEALQAFFEPMPADPGMAFIVVTHLGEGYESSLPQILSRSTEMPIAAMQDGGAIEPNHVYVLGPGAVPTLRRGRLRLNPRSAGRREFNTIDVFLASLAEDRGEYSVAVILSGTGHDGTLGVKAIKEKGGLTIAQGSNTSRPRFPEMPANAVAAGFVDLSFPVEDIPERLFAYVRDFDAFDPERPSDALSNIYTLLRRRTGHDFSAYKDTTFHRRVQRRMQVLQTASLDDYVERLRKEPEEVSALFRDLLIGVTDFFRDAAAFHALETLVIPKLFEGKSGDDEVRVWVAGCSSGEEAYSIAILLREQMDQLRVVRRLQIFATDIDEAALSLARTARICRYWPRMSLPNGSGASLYPRQGAFAWRGRCATCASSRTTASFAIRRSRAST